MSAPACLPTLCWPACRSALQVLDVGRDLLQSFKPLKSAHEHVCAWHFYARTLGLACACSSICSAPDMQHLACLRACVLACLQTT